MLVTGLLPHSKIASINQKFFFRGLLAVHVFVFGLAFFTEPELQRVTKHQLATYQQIAHGQQPAPIRTLFVSNRLFMLCQYWKVSRSKSIVNLTNILISISSASMKHIMGSQDLL